MALALLFVKVTVNGVSPVVGVAENAATITDVEVIE